MKTTLLFFTLFLAPLFAQNGYVTTIPDRPLNIYTSGRYAHVKGHWVPRDKNDKGSQLVGPTAADITCTGDRCIERLAILWAFGDTFSLSAEDMEYKIERWTNKEIVATTVDGTCKVRYVLKFDLVTKQVFGMQSLAEPDTSNDPGCRFAGMNLELKAETTWKRN